MYSTALVATIACRLGDPFTTCQYFPPQYQGVCDVVSHTPVVPEVELTVFTTSEDSTFMEKMLRSVSSTAAPHHDLEAFVD